MAPGFDASELLEIFLAEADELLQQMDQALVTLEASPCEQEALEALFRAAHTLKAVLLTAAGSSRSTEIRRVADRLKP